MCLWRMRSGFVRLSGRLGELSSLGTLRMHFKRTSWSLGGNGDSKRSCPLRQEWSALSLMNRLCPKSTRALQSWWAGFLFATLVLLLPFFHSVSMGISLCTPDCSETHCVSWSNLELASSGMFASQSDKGVEKWWLLLIVNLTQCRLAREEALSRSGWPLSMSRGIILNVSWYEKMEPVMGSTIP